MNEKTIKNYEDSVNDCLDKAFACDFDSEDYPILMDKAVALGKVINEHEKIKNEKEIELKKIEASQVISQKDKFNASKDFVDLALRSGFLAMMLKAVSNYELNNTYISSASRWVLGTLREIWPFKNRRG